MAKLTKDSIEMSAFNARIPRDRYTLRIIKVEQAVSKSSNNPMLIVTAEVLGKDGNETVTNERGERVNVAGVQITYYLVLNEKNAGRLFEFFSKLGFNCDEIDTENPLQDKQLEGVIFDAILSSEERIPYGQDNKPITGRDGKPVSLGYVIQSNTSDIVGLSSWDKPLPPF